MRFDYNPTINRFGGYYETKLIEIAEMAKQLGILYDDAALYNYTVYTLGSENFMQEDTLDRIRRIAAKH